VSDHTTYAEDLLVAWEYRANTLAQLNGYDWLRHIAQYFGRTRIGCGFLLDVVVCRHHEDEFFLGEASCDNSVVCPAVRRSIARLLLLNATTLRVFRAAPFLSIIFQ